MISRSFEQQASQHPNRPAVVHGGRTLTYQRLRDLAWRIAGALARPGGLPDGASPKNVGLFFEQGSDMVAAVLGALHGDVLYVPLDVHYPQRRLAYMLENAECDAVLTNRACFPQAEALVQAASCKPALLVLDELSASDGTDSSPVQTGDAPAYILYTSGSTGRPKGVVQSRANLLHHAMQWIACAGLGAGDRVSLLSPLSHDASIPDLFGALLSGATLCPFDVLAAGSLRRLAEWLVKERITVWHSVPTLFRRFAECLHPADQFPSLRWIVLGGEAVRDTDLQIARTYFGQADFGVIYGQSESTITAFWRAEKDEDSHRITLGAPVGGARLFLAAEDGSLIEGMGTGELVIASETTVLGYWRDEAATQAAFSKDPELGKLYWTGDMGRLAADGSIMLLGRKDAQVKIRGHRVEPAEIENALMAHDEISNAVAVASPGADGEPELRAFFVARSDVEPRVLRDLLARELPDYMVPGYFQRLPEVPLLPNGKIDYAKLRAMPRGDNERQTIAPARTATESKVAQLWKNLLGTEDIGSDSDFFELGGHSLAVLDLLSEIHEVFQADLNFRDVVQGRTVEQLALRIEEAQTRVTPSIRRGELREYYPLSPAQKRVFLLAQRQGAGTALNMPAALDIEGPVERERFQNAVQALILRHASLRTSFQILNGMPVQVVHQSARCAVIERRVSSEAEIAGAVREFIRPFALEDAPLLRFQLFRKPDGRCTVLTDIHPIICDGVSQGILVRDLIALYLGQELPPLEIQYVDYVLWRLEMARCGALRPQEKYWLDRLSGEISRVDLAADFERPAAGVFGSERLRHSIHGSAAERFREAVTGSGTSLFMAVMAALNVVLYRRTGQSDLVVGAGGTGRSKPSLNRMIGLFANELAIRTQLNAELSFSEYLHVVQGACLDALKNSDVRVEDLTDRLNLISDPSRNPLFPVLVAMQDSERWNVDAAGVRVARDLVPPSATWFDLTLFAHDDGSAVHLDLEFCMDLFRRTSIENLARQVEAVIIAVGDRPDVRIREIEIPELRRRAPAAAAPQAAARPEGHAPGRRLPVSRCEEREYYLASCVQEVIYRKHQVNPAKYNRDPIAFQLTGRFDFSRFQTAVERLIERHEPLRTSFHEVDGMIVQRVHRRAHLEIPVGSCSEQDLPKRLEGFILPFRIEEAPLFRINVLQVSPQRHLILFDIHHIIYDADSMQVLQEELGKLYRGAALLPELPLQYRDYAAWERQVVLQGFLGSCLDYWRRVFHDVRPSKLPPTTPRPAGHGHAIRDRRLKREAHAAMNGLCREYGCTRLALLLAAFARVLCERTREDEVAFGLRTSTRPHSCFRNAIGPFLNKVLIRSRAGRSEPLADLARRIQVKIGDALEHGLYPYDYLCADLCANNGTGQAGRFHILVNYQAATPGEAQGFGPEITVSPVRIARPSMSGVVGYQFVLAIFEYPGHIILRAIYDQAECSQEDALNIMDDIGEVIVGAAGEREESRVIRSEAERATAAVE